MKPESLAYAASLARVGERHRQAAAQRLAADVQSATPLRIRFIALARTHARPAAAGMRRAASTPGRPLVLAGSRSAPHH